MDIAALSMVMHQASIQNAVSISVMKMAMNNEVETGTQMTDMMRNVGVDTNRGTNIDIKV